MNKVSLFVNFKIKNLWLRTKQNLSGKLAATKEKLTNLAFLPVGVTPEGVLIPVNSSTYFSVSANQIGSLSKEDKIETLKELLGRFIGGVRDEIPPALKVLCRDSDPQIARAAQLLHSLFLKYRGEALLSKDEEYTDLKTAGEAEGIKITISRDLFKSTDFAERVFEKKIIPQELLGLLGIRYDSKGTEIPGLGVVTEAPPVGVIEAGALAGELWDRILPHKVSINTRDFIAMHEPLPISDFTRSIIVMETDLAVLVLKFVPCSKAAEFFAFLFSEQGEGIFWSTMVRFKRMKSGEDIAPKREEFIKNILKASIPSDTIAEILSCEELSTENAQILLSWLGPYTRKRVLASTKLKIT